MRPRLTIVVALCANAALAAACATIAGIDAPGNGSATRDGAEPEDASLVVDGALQTPEGVTISPAELTLGTVKCQETKSGSIAITNNGAAAIPYEIVITNNDTFTLRGSTDGVLKGDVAPGDYVIVYVDVKGIAPGPRSADVVVRAGKSVQQISAKLEVTGALLAVTPPIIDFGDLRKQTVSAPSPIKLENTGNETITVTGFSGLTNDFQLSRSTITIAPGTFETVDAVMTSGAAADTAATAMITPEVLGVLCSAPTAVTLKGKRVDNDVTVGPLLADFGDFNCGVTPANQAKIAVTNYSTIGDATYDAKLLTTLSRFKIVGAASGSVLKSASVMTPNKVDITIGANAVGLPLGEIDEDLEVTTTSLAQPAEPPVVKLVRLHIGAYGAILVVEPPTLTGFAINETKAFAITNVGNRRTCVRYSDVSGNGYYIEADDELRPNENDDLRVQFAATTSGTYDYTIQITRSNCWGENAPICVPPPSPTVSATR